MKILKANKTDFIMTQIPDNLPDDKFRALVQIVEILRSPEGCPWDRKQTHKSLLPHLLEEAHEVVESVDEENWDELKKELGDLLMHVVFQASMSKDDDLFDIDEVLQSVIEKLVRRHPHVFGESDVKDADEVVKNWEQIKMEEGRKSVIDGVPKALSGLIRAHRLQQKAAQVGFDWDEINPVWDKVYEELDELKEVMQSGESELVHEEFGDLLFTLVNLSRFMKINPEDALRHSTNKFIRRFQAVEKRVEDQDLDMNSMSLQELDEHWNEIKLTEKPE
jgi:MazG family protein